MNVLKKAIGICTSSLNALLNNVEQPDKILDIQIERLDKQVVTVQTSVVAAIANRNMIEKKYKKTCIEYEQYDKKIELALTQNKEELAREIAIEQNIVEITKDKLRKSLKKEKEECEKLKKVLTNLEQKIKELRNKKYVLVIKYQSAKARNKVQDTLSKVSMDSPIKEINRMERKIEELDSKACAKSELSNNDIDNKIVSLSSEVNNQCIDNKIASIKEKISNKKKEEDKQQNLEL